jgi:hypothetical protein
MPTYIEYALEDGMTILVRAPEEESRGMVMAGNKPGESILIKAEKDFEQAFESVKRSATVIKQKLEDLQADEVEVKFGLTTTGKLGNFAVGEIGVEANYEVTLKWKNSKTYANPKKKNPQNQNLEDDPTN